MENEIGDTRNFYDNNNDDNSALLSVANDLLSQLFDQKNNIFLDRDDNDTEQEDEDSDSHYDKRQSHQDDGLLEQMRSRNKRYNLNYISQGKSTSDNSSNNKSTTKKDAWDADDFEFGEFDYTNRPTHNSTDKDKQEEEEIGEYYLNIDEPNTKTREKDKKKKDIIYTRSNPYMTYQEWTD